MQGAIPPPNCLFFPEPKVKEIQFLDRRKKKKKKKETANLHNEVGTLKRLCHLIDYLIYYKNNDISDQLVD